jgi:ATP-dependent helicase/nuclease subunit B
MMGVAPSLAKVFYIPPTAGFLRTLVQGLLNRTARQPEELAYYRILLPTRRACRMMADLFLDATDGKPILLPHIQAVADIDDQELEILVMAATGTPPDLSPAITPLARQILLAELVGKLPDFADYGRAAQMAGALTELLDSVRNEDMDFCDLDRLVPEQYADHWQQTLEFLKILRIHYPEILKAENKIDPTDRRNRLLDMLALYWRDFPPAGPIIMAGVTGSLPAVARLMDVVCRLPRGELILAGFNPDEHEYYLQSMEDTHPAAEMARLLTRLDVTPIQIDVWPDYRIQSITSSQFARQWLWRHIMAPSDATTAWSGLKLHLDPNLKADLKNIGQSIQVIESDQVQDEAMAVALCVRHALVDPAAAIAIITPDRSLARGIMLACQRFDIRVNDSAGQKLSTTSRGQFLLQVLSVVLTGLNPIDVLACLRHSCCQFHDNPDVDVLDKLALRGLRPGQNPDNFLRDIRVRLQASDDRAVKLAESFTVILRPLFTDQDTRFPAQHWIRIYITAVEDLAGQKAAQLWQEEDGTALANLFASLLDPSLILPELTLPDYAAFIRYHLDSIRVNKVGDEHPRVALLGTFEARLTAASTVILAGFNEGAWPGKIDADPWMSRSMRHDFKLPAREVDIGRMAHDIMQWVTADKLIITRTKRSDGALTVPSRWLQRLDAVLTGLDLSPAIVRDHYVLHLVYQMDGLDIPVVPVVRPEPCVKSGLRPQTYSASDIGTLMRDPYDFYARKVLRLHALDPHNQELDARITGNILHDVLYRFHKVYDRDLSSDLVAELLMILEDSFPKFIPDIALSGVVRPRLQRILKNYLVQLKSWQSETGGRAISLEQTWVHKFELNKFLITLHARMDRIDLLRDGTCAIIDYKSGSLPTKKNVERGLDPQIILEMMLFERGTRKDETRSITLHQTISHLRLWPLKVDGNKDLDFSGHDLDDLRTNLDQGLYDLLAAFMMDDQPYLCLADQESARRYSDYRHLARVAEWSSHDSGDDT